MSLQLFPPDEIVGAFRGFREGGLEFHADLALPYRNEFQNIPMHGQFLLVQLETPDEAVLGRISSFSSEGKLSYGAGEEFNLRAVRENRPVPEDLREQYLKYRVNIRVLGIVRSAGERLTFVPSQRRLPHVGSPVAFPSGEVLREIAGHRLKDGVGIGHLAYGEYVYADGSALIEPQDWMQIRSPEILTKFPVSNLVSRRSFIFARAGFGKSNLNKLLFSKLYHHTPSVIKRHNREVPVGTIIFDPDGEYFWPDDKGRPGLCDVPELEDKLVVFTSRRNPSSFYQSFVADGVKLDIRSLVPADVISIALPPERQQQQNVIKLKSLSSTNWQKLVDLIDENGNHASTEEVSKLLRLDSSQEVEAIAARSNMHTIVKMLHDRNSQMMQKLFAALKAGKICVVDISQLRGGPSLVLSGLILRRIFDYNQSQFTEAEPQTIPTIAVIEEAQSVLNEKASGSAPYVEWVKEGRKYDLGALMITQQPGSIPDEILSQGDNWFIFHLLSASDLTSVRRANAHFSDDILSSLLNEPIPGHCVFWSSVGGTPYPISLRILSFERMYQARDLTYSAPAAKTFATTLNNEFRHKREELIASLDREEKEILEETIGETEPDFATLIQARCVQALKNHAQNWNWLNSPNGLAWGALNKLFEDTLQNQNILNVNEEAYNMVPKVMEQLFGKRDNGWFTFKKNGKTYLTTKKPIQQESNSNGYQSRGLWDAQTGDN